MRVQDNHNRLVNVSLVESLLLVMLMKVIGHMGRVCIKWWGGIHNTRHGIKFILFVRDDRMHGNRQDHSTINIAGHSESIQ